MSNAETLARVLRKRGYEVHDSSGTPLLLLHGGLFDIHQQFGELLTINEAPQRAPGVTAGGEMCGVGAEEEILSRPVDERVSGGLLGGWRVVEFPG